MNEWLWWVVSCGAMALGWTAFVAWVCYPRGRRREVRESMTQTQSLVRHLGKIFEGMSQKGEGGEKPE